jgi:hypothetical protein
VVLALLALTLTPAHVGALETGGLVGFVADTSGLPIPGVVVSIFGKGLGAEGVVTLTDGDGRFVLPSLPAGSYTLRAIGRGHRPASARAITVQANAESVFQLSLTPLTLAEQQELAERARELAWLLRHKRRSVLESSETSVQLARHDALESAPEPPAIAGSLEVVATSATLGVGEDALVLDATPSSASLVRFEGRLTERGHWAIGGSVTESQRKAWRTAASMALDTGIGHTVAVGAGYGQRALRPVAPTLGEAEGSLWGVGAVVAEDRIALGRAVFTAAGRFSYVGFLTDTAYIDPRASLELTDDEGTRVRASFTRATLVPGGDLLTLSPFASDGSLSHALMDPALRAERRALYEVGFERLVGRTVIETRLFQETLQDPLVHAYQGAGAARSLRIANAGDRAARGMALGLSRSFGLMQASLRYGFGRTEGPRQQRMAAPTPTLPFADGSYHDVVARVETVIPGSDTRLLALYRVSTVDPDGEDAAGIVNSRFDIQLRQGLPLLGSLMPADWELLVAYRNLFYDEGEGGTLDELLVLNPPHRVLGGISVRF